MKIPDQLRKKRIPQIQQIYDTNLDIADTNNETIYEIIQLFKKIDEGINIQKQLSNFIDKLELSQQEEKRIKEKPIKAQIKEITKGFIIKSFEQVISNIIIKMKEYYPQAYDDNAKINLNKILYQEDGLTFNQRINNFFKDYYNEKISLQMLSYHMLLINTVETYQITPRIMQIKIKDKTYVQIIAGHGCGRPICNDDILPEEAYPEDEVELPPYHSNCKCEAIFYSESEIIEILNEDK